MAVAQAGKRRPAARESSARLGSARLGSARLGSARLGSARLGSARLGSARLGSARLGSARLGSARLGSARLGSARLGSARLGSARLGSARLGSARLGSARLGSARLGSARLGSARLGSARLGSARLGSARLGSALIMRTNGPGRFCQVFLRVIHNFSPSAPFRLDNRAPPHTSRKKWSIRTNRHRKTSFGPVVPVDPARSSAWFSFVYAFVGWVCQGAGGGVFRRFTSSFQVGVEAIIGQKYFGGFFDHSLVILLVTKYLRVCRNNSVRIPGSST